MLKNTSTVSRWVENKMELYMDIETTALDADTGMIVAVGIGWEKKETVIEFVNSHDEEKQVISNAFSKIAEKQIVTFNGSRFDIPFLLTRGLKYDLAIPKVEVIDLYVWAAEYLRLHSHRFHDICTFYDIPHEEISGSEVNELYIKALSGDKGAKDRIKSHLKQDISAMKVFYGKIQPLISNYPSPNND